MEDIELHSLRREPSAAFAARLQASLREQGASRSRAVWPRMKAVAAPVLVVAGIGGLLSVPSVRASAQSFLARFRVVNFVAVPVDESRLAILEAENLDPPHLIGEQVQVLEDPGPPIGAVSTEQAGAAAGFEVRVPSYVPTSALLAGIEVKGQQHLRVTPDTGRLREVMDALAISDLEVPPGLDGEIVDVRMSPVVTLKYDRGGALAAQVLQTRSPEVSLPDGFDLGALGEIGLRILGLPPIEAREFARAIDWRTTLIVPLPAAASSFKQVNINGHAGVSIERVRYADKEGGPGRTTILLWSADGMVFGIESAGFSSQDLLRMAESL